jgi:CRP/FNR family transcriptional regulator
MSSISEINRDLKILPCLSVLGDEHLSYISEKAFAKRFARNEAIFVESDSMKFFFVVRSGAIKLFKTSKEGREIVVKIIGPGEFSCCAPLYTDDERFFMNAVAIEDSVIVMVPADSFKKMLNSNVNPIGLKIISGLCMKIKYLSKLVEDLTFKDVEQRIILTLLRIAEEKASEESIVALTVTHQDIASMTGTVREVVSRTMARFKKEGVIASSSARGFKIDKDRLSRLLKRKYPIS